MKRHLQTTLRQTTQHVKSSILYDTSRRNWLQPFLFKLEHVFLSNGKDKFVKIVKCECAFRLFLRNSFNVHDNISSIPR